MFFVAPSHLAFCVFVPFVAPIVWIAFERVVASCPPLVLFVATISPFVLLCFCAFCGSDLAFERAVTSCPPLAFL